MADIVQRAGKVTRSIAAAHEIRLDQVIVYGSYAQGEAGDQSDIDLVLVSPDWAGVDYYERPEAFLLEWPRKKLPTPDIIPLTPEEFARRSQSETDIVQTAAKTGIVTG